MQPSRPWHDWEERLRHPDAPLYPIGVVADLLGTDVATIRRYGDTGIVSPDRTDSGQRRYSRNEIADLARALDLAAEGITPPGIRRILALEDQVEELRRNPPD